MIRFRPIPNNKKSVQRIAHYGIPKQQKCPIDDFCEKRGIYFHKKIVRL